MVVRLHAVGPGFMYRVPCRVGLVVIVSASHTVGRQFASRSGHNKDHQTASLHGTQCVRVRI